jgi:hypothetical protein
MVAVTCNMGKSLVSNKPNMAYLIGKQLIIEAG